MSEPRDLRPPRSRRQYERQQIRVHRALGALEQAPRWLLAMYRDDLDDLGRRAMLADIAVRRGGWDPDEEGTPA